MIDDLANAGGTRQIDTDVCVVGSGAAGLAFAREFLGTTMRVLVLESGGVNREERAASLNQGRDVGVPNPGLIEGRLRIFGGTTDIWPGACVPLTEMDLSERPWVPFSGWPISFQDIQPYYRRAADLLHVAVEAFQEEVWSVVGVDGLEFDERLLSHFIALFSPRPYRFLGKVLRQDLQRASNIRVLLHATATELRTDPSGTTVESLEARSLTGQRVEIRARAFLLACGGFENARLLLLSRAVESAGVGNRHDLVGRFYQDHPHARVGTIHADRPTALQKRYGASFRGFPPKPKPYPKIRLSPKLQQREGVLNSSATIVWDNDAQAGEEGLVRLFRAVRSLRTPVSPREEIMKIIRDLPGTARFVGRYVRGRASITPPRSMWLLNGAEQAPNPDSRITLDDELDGFGLPRVRLNWRMTELDRRTAEVMAEAVGQELHRMGLARLDIPSWLKSGTEGWSANMFGVFHPSGTTRMAQDPTRGVVDEHCQVHGMSNLHIAGSSVFPTSGYANPTFTIVALAIRLADRMKSALG